MLKKIFNQKTLFGFIFLTMVLSTVYVVIKIILAPTVVHAGEPTVRVKGDYTLMLLQCAFGIVALNLPSFIEKRFKIAIPSDMIIAYAVFLFCAIYLGEVRSFYYNVPHWDTILHTFSGAMLGALGFTLISFLNKTDGIPVNLSPLFVAIFTFCFAAGLGVVWEVYEFTMDSILLTNMQKFALENGTPLIGQAALRDTMKDLIVDCIGALVFSIFGYISLKTDKGWYNNLFLKKLD